MKHTMQYSVGDEVAHVPSSEADEFNAVAKEQNVTPEPIFTYRVSNKQGDVQQLDVPKAEYEEFAKTAGDNGYKIEPLRMMTMDDGTERYFSARELRAFMRSPEYLNSTDGAEAKARDEAVRQRIAEEEANAPGFWSELGRRMFTVGGARDNAEDSDWAKPYAYANDLCNALVGGLLKGSAKIEQAFGHLVGSDAIVRDAQAGQAAVDEYLPTDALDTKKPGAANKVLDVGKNVASVTGEFAPSLIPGVGQAYAASLVGGGATIRYMQVYDDAIAHGVDPDKAVGLASLGATVDAGQNMLLMGKFKGVWKGEQANLAQAAKEGLVRRLTKDTLKTGAIMSGGGMAGDVIDQAAEDKYWLDVERTAKVGFDQFIEGGLFHLVNTGVHNATRIKWGDDAKGIPAGAARDMMEAPEGRALIFSNSPDAARAIFKARRNGENVSRKMIEDLGLSGDVARTAADRNALGDRLMADYDAFKERVRTKMDDVQAAALTDEIASRSEEGVNNPAFEKVWFKAVEQIKDATELDDPARRKEIVDEAVKTTETPEERRQREQAVEDAIKARQAEDAAAQKAAEEGKTTVLPPETAPKATVEAPKTSDEAKSVEIQAATKPEEAGTTKETSGAPSAPTPVPARPAEARGTEEAYNNWLKGFDFEDTPENRKNFDEMVAIGRADPKTGETIRPAAYHHRGYSAYHDFDDSDQHTVYGKDLTHKLGTFPTRKEAIDFIENGGAHKAEKRIAAEAKAEKAAKDKEAAKADAFVSGVADKFRSRAEDLIKRADGKPTDEMREEGRLLVDEIAQELSTMSESELYKREQTTTDKWMVSPIRKAREIAMNRERADMTLREADDYHARYENENAEFEKKRPALEKKLAEITAKEEAKRKEIDEYQENFNGTDDELLKDDTRNRLCTEWRELLKQENEAKSAIRPPETPRERNLREHKEDISYVKDHLSYLKQLKRNAEKAGNPTDVHDADIAKYEGFLKSLKSNTDARVSVKAVPVVSEKDVAEKPTLVAEKPVDKPSATEDVQKNGTSSRTLSDVARELEASKGLANPEERDKKVAKLQDEIDAMRTPGKDFEPFAGKPNAAKAAKCVADFLYKQTEKEKKDPKRSGDKLAKVFHDKESGVAVATDGRVMIATKHGFDPNGEADPTYPNWRIVVPKEENTPLSTKVNPTALAKTCKEVLRLARATGLKTDSEYSVPKIALKFGDFVNHFSAEYMLKVAKAMEANGITEIRTADKPGHPGVAKNGDTTIVFMPYRGANGDNTRTGRGDGGFVVNGYNGRIIAAPERTDGNMPEMLRTSREAYDKSRAESVGRAKKQSFYTIIRDAQKKGMGDPAEIYDTLVKSKDAAPFAKLNDENKAIFTDWVKTSDAEALASKVADYLDRSQPWFKDGPKEIAKFEKRIAAEDEIEGLIMRGQEARDFLGIKPEKAKPAEKVSDYDVEQEVKRVVGLIGKAENAAQLKEYADSFKFKDLDMVDGIKIDHDRISEALNKRSEELFGEKKPDAKRSAEENREEDERILRDYDKLADAPNVINGDAIRRNMTGFKHDDPSTHEPLRERSVAIRERLFDQKLKDRKGKGTEEPNVVMFTMGGGGSGKSTASKGLADKVDFTYDSTGANIADMRDKIRRVIENGQKPMVLFVYADPKTAWGRVAERTSKGGHAVSEKDFEEVHAKAIENFDSLRREFGNAILSHVVDNRGGAGKSFIMDEDAVAKLPRYTKEQIHELVGQEDSGSRRATRDREHPGERGQVIRGESGNAQPNGENVSRSQNYAEIGELIGNHLKAQTTAKNNAAGRKFKEEAKDALAKRLSELSDDDYASVKNNLKAIMGENGLDPAKAGYVQAIFNAETAKRNAEKKTTASNPVNLIDSDKAFSSAYERLVDAHANNDASRTKETSDEVRRFRDVIKSLVKDAKTEDLKTTWDTIAGGMEKDIEKKGTMALFGKPIADVLGAIRGELLDRGPKLDKYLATKKPLEAGRILKTLNKKIDFGGDLGVLTEAQLIDRAADNGKSVVSAITSTSKNGKPSVVFTLDGNVITATAANYARARGVKIDENALARAAERAKLITMFGEDKLYATGNTDSDADIESRIVDMSGKVKTLGNMRMDDGMTYAERLDALKQIKDARVKRGDWNLEPAKTEPAKTEPVNVNPGKFTDSVYEAYKSGRMIHEGASAFAKDAIAEAKARVGEEIEKFTKNGDTVRVRELNGDMDALKEIESELADTFDNTMSKSDIHVALRKLLENVNAISPIEGFEDISDFQPRRGDKRTGVRAVDEFNDTWDDEGERIKDSKRFFDTKDEYDEEVASEARDVLDKEIAISKDVYDKLSAGDKRYFDKLVGELDNAKREVVEEIFEGRSVDMGRTREFLDAFNAVEQFGESARKMSELMRDNEGRPVLYTEKSHATEMAADGVRRAVKAFASRDPAEATAATEMINLAIENGGKFPTKKQVAEMAKDMPEEMRETFTRNADALRKYADGLKDKPSIADEATKLAEDVDAAIDAEEKGGGERPDAAPRGRGTGAISQDEPKPQGTTTTGKTSGIVTPQSFLKEARKLFPDVAMRGKGTARMAKWAAGHFEATTRTIRSRDMSAIRTITHELGHDLEYLTRYDLPRNPAAKRDLSDLGHALYPSGPGMPKPNSYIGEGFAEYVRGYICNAPDLAQVAPDMDAWFRGDFKAKHPEIVSKIDRLRDMVQTMKEQSAADTVRGFRHPATTVVERAWKKVTDFGASENWNDAASTILKGMKKSGIDKLYHWQDEFKELEAAVKAGDTVRAQQLAASVSDKVANHPYLFPTITRGTASQRVMDMARHGTTNLLGNQRTGESLKEIFADFSHKEQEAWKDYAIARHGIENYYAKGLEFGMPKDVLEDVVRQYDSPKFQQALQRVTDYSHRILHLGVDAGLISQEAYDKIVAEHPIYVRITRRKADDGAGTKQGGAAINKRTGGFENILDPIDAMLMDQEKYLRACFQAKSLQLIVGAANRAKAANLQSIRNNGGPNTSTVNPRSQSHIAVSAYWPIEVPNAQEKVTFGAGKLKQGLSDAAADYAARTGEDPIPLEEFINDLATYTDPQGRVTQLSVFRDKPSQGKHNLVSVYVDGKLHTYELPDMKWANMLTDVYDKSDFSKAERVFGLATAGIRLGATTINPGFAIRNGIRDSLHSAVMSETGAIPMLGTLNGMLNQLTGKEAAQMFRSMGGHMSDLVGVTREQKWHHGGKVALAQNAFQSAMSYGWDWVLMKPVIKAMSDILSVPELGPRVREFNGVLQKCRAAGLTEDVAAMLAMSHAKDISIDFQRAGRCMKHINHYIPFSNAMWRGTEQTFRNLGVLPALPHQFEDRGMERGAKTVGKGLAFITSWAMTLAMLEMNGDEKDKRRVFEREPVEKWEYEHAGDWRIPLPFEAGYIFSAIPKAVVYEMNGDKGAVAECLKFFNQAMPTKYLDPSSTVGSISLLTPMIGLWKNENYRGREIVPEKIKEKRIKEEWYTQYTTEMSKRIGRVIGQSPAQLEYIMDSYTGGLYRRVALAVENIGDTSRLKEGRGFSMLDTLRARPQANRLVSDFYKFGEEANQKLGSGILSLEDYGKLASMDGVKKELTDRFGEMRAIRADKSIPLAEQDKRVQAIAEDVNETIRNFNARDDYRQRGIAYAASHLTGSTLESLDEGTRQQYTALLKDVPTNEIVQALIKFGNETVMVKQKGVKVPHQRWSNKNVNTRVGRLLMLMQGR